MKDDNKRTAVDTFMEFWEGLEPSKRVAFCWVASVAVILITLGILFPIFGFILFCLAAVVGTVVSLAHLFID